MILVVVHGIMSDSSAWDPLVELTREDADLGGRVGILRVDYPSKAVELSPSRRLPDLDTVAGCLTTQLTEELPPDLPVVFAAHSQGGLIVQRYLAQQLSEGRGLELRRIRRVLMFATPNSGSEYLLTLRKRWQRNPQERELRPINDKIIETQRTILDRVVNADVATATTVPIPIEAYAGLTDRIVLPQSAKSVFPECGVLPGDHSSIIRPSSTQALMYRLVKSRLLQEIRRGADSPGPPTIAGGTSELDYGIEVELRASSFEPARGCPLSDDAVRAIAAALADIPDLVDPVTRKQFMLCMPRYVRERLLHGGDNPRIELSALVHRCAAFEGTGRDALVISLEWAFAVEDPAVARALAVIEQQWPVAEAVRASHTV